MKGKDCIADIPEGKAAQRHQCDACKECFCTAQALGGYRVNCKVAKDTSAILKRTELEKNTIMDEFTTTVADETKEKHKDTKPHVRGATLVSAQVLMQ